ncbi:MAG TPA: aminotransferase class V-fold PLP-dependent enzyme [Thermoanaerobaculia bacterium]|nr:aminotransferase class V-fold PLP-dependent enzyme [Thermoanaerobaculia bacterium]
MLTRRSFLATSSLAAVAIAAKPKAPAPNPSTDLTNWPAVRANFAIDPTYIHLGLFYMASHPRPVQAAIEEYRRKLDANPFLTVERSMFEKPEDHLPTRACSTIANYIGGKPDDIALTQNTTTGLSLIYHGLPLKPGDEILTTNHDHYVHHEAIRYATERAGATWRKIPLFDSHDKISADDMVDRIRKAVGPKTRAVGVTWVHSSTGLKLPIRRIADAIAEVNKQRGDRVLLIVDGVHGIGVEDPNIVAMGMDAFAAGTHKWIFGPRGTGFAWAKGDVWATMRPLIPTFTSLDVFEAWSAEKTPAQPPRAAWFSPGGFWAFEHYWALPAAFGFHRRIGSARITERIHSLNEQMREGLAKMPHVILYTPRSNDLAAGIVCFDVKGMKQTEVVQRLLEKDRIIASTTPYAISYARVAFGIHNTPAEVEKTLAAVRALA